MPSCLISEVPVFHFDKCILAVSFLGVCWYNSCSLRDLVVFEKKKKIGHPEPCGICLDHLIHRTHLICCPSWLLLWPYRLWTRLWPKRGSSCRIPVRAEDQPLWVWDGSRGQIRDCCGMSALGVPLRLATVWLAFSRELRRPDTVFTPLFLR